MKIAFACELTPAKTFIPVIKRLRKINLENLEIIALAHGDGAEELIAPYTDKVYYIGTGRSSGSKKKIKKFYLIAKDLIKAIKAMKKESIDLLVSCGNAGDVRKSVTAAYFLGIPVIHIEQDVYNPIEAISLANIVTLPSKEYKNFLQKEYKLKNIEIIGGYPMVSYINEFIKNNLKTREEVENTYFKSNEEYRHNKLSDYNKLDDYIFVVLGGDLREEDIPKLIKSIKKYNFPIVVAPYRFDKDIVKKYVNQTSSKNIIVLDNYVDVVSLIKYCKLLIYGAGMGLTIEAGILKKPTIKIEGFHKQQGSVDLAKQLNIPLLKIEDLPEDISSLEEIKGDLTKDSQIAIENLISLIKDYKSCPKKSGFSSYKSILSKRKKSNNE
ncbi:MAG: UDP-N-acetyl glucosamine 2-epimerase [Methanobrevibacter sp.]|jgi:UDP-N-acetylglucosamine:LPS N-acetylglucosamine transferase|nr:UDP-N-acetyl glucosamine 2-epimerase [Candidatus Methanovirga australis]